MDLVFIEPPDVLLHVFPVALQQRILLHQFLILRLLLNLKGEGVLSGLVAHSILLDYYLLGAY